MPPTSTYDLTAAAQAAYRGLPITIEGEGNATTRDFHYTAEGLAVSGTIRVDGYKLHLTRIEARPADQNAELTAAMVKAIPTGRIMSNLATLIAIERARLEAEGKAHTPLFTREQALGDPQDRKRPAQRGGQPLVNEEMLRQLAELYLEETAEGKPSRPIKRIAERLGWPEGTVTTRLARARKEGWLAASVKGRAGGEPGPKLLLARLAKAAGLTPREGETEQESADRLHAVAVEGGELYDRLKAEGKL